MSCPPPPFPSPLQRTQNQDQSTIHTPFSESKRSGVKETDTPMVWTTDFLPIGTVNTMFRTKVRELFVIIT